MIKDFFRDYEIILASQSPRRQALLKEVGIDFTVKVIEGITEKYPENLSATQIPVFLAKQKASFYTNILKDNSILITADTIVVLNNEVLEKPENFDHAVYMLKKLSNNKHEVITGIALTSPKRQKTFFVNTKVYFKSLTDKEIHFYINNYKPYDKAGAYGIQEWIGYVAIKKIVGSYNNVVGLPVQKLFTELCNFIGKK